MRHTQGSNRKSGATDCRAALNVPSLCAPRSDHKKEPLDLTKCSRLTSDNVESCHFEIHGCKLGKGPVQFRVSKQRWEIEGGIRGDFNYYDKNEWEAVKIVFEHLGENRTTLCLGTCTYTHQSPISLV